MFEQLPHTFLHRELRTSEPRFTRITRTHLIESKVKDSNSRNFPSVNRGNALDNSKQNLYYQTHLTKVKSACKLDETTIVSKYLGSIRKNYDDMSKASRSQLNSVKLKKREIQLMKRKNQVFYLSRVELQNKIAAKEKETNEVRVKEDDAKMQTKILENIIMRMKKDQIFYKQYGRLKDEELKQKAKDLKCLDESLIHQDQKLHKLATSLDQCKLYYDKNREVRQKKYQDYSHKIQEVCQRNKFIQERKQRTYQLQSIELNDTLDQKNIHMRQIILAHRVADSMLESKVSKLIKKNANIQAAFHMVRIKTGVSQPQLLTSKFFSYEQTAQSLLQSIAQNQSSIQNLVQKKEKLMAEYRSLNEETLSINQEQVCYHMGFEEALKNKMKKQANRSQLLSEQIVSWTDSYLKQFGHGENPKTSTIAQKFKALCNSVKQQIKKYQHIQFKQKKVEILGVRLKKVVKEASAQQLSIRLRQTEDMNDSNLIQQQFIQTSRQNISKKKFNIKQAKREPTN